MGRSLVRALVVPASGGGGALTVAESDGAPSVANVTTIKFDQADGFTVVDDGGGTVTINVAAAPAPDLDAQILAWLHGGSD